MSIQDTTEEQLRPVEAPEGTLDTPSKQGQGDPYGHDPIYGGRRRGKQNETAVAATYQTTTPGASSTGTVSTPRPTDGQQQPETPKPRGFRGAIKAYKDRLKTERDQELEDIKRENPDVNQVTDTMSDTDIFKLLHPQKTPQQIQREEHKAKVEEDWAAIQDALNALSEMSTSPTHTYTPRTTLSDQARARREKLEAQRKADRNAYFESYLKARQADKTLKARLAQEKFKNELALSKERREQAAQDSKLRVDQSTIARNTASAAASLRKEADKEGKEKYHGSIRIGGQEQSYRTAADYNKAVAAYAKQYGVPTTVTENIGFGKTKTTHRQVSDIVADIEAKANQTTTQTGGRPSPTARRISPTLEQ
jgi:hypothetical protein